MCWVLAMDMVLIRERLTCRLQEVHTYRHQMDRHHMDRHHMDRHHMDRHHMDRHHMDRHHMDSNT
jgi:hypothetical protein